MEAFKDGHKLFKRPSSEGNLKVLMHPFEEFVKIIDAVNVGCKAKDLLSEDTHAKSFCFIIGLFGELFLKPLI